MSEPKIHTFGVAKYVYAAAYDQMKAERDDLKLCLQCAQDDVTKLKAENGEYFSRLEVLKDECKRLNAERDEWAAQIAQMTRHNKAVSANALKLQAENGRLRGAMEDCKREANNVMYFGDNSDYGQALREVCIATGLSAEDAGRSYIDESGQPDHPSSCGTGRGAGA